jgi:hypothetical protein
VRVYISLVRRDVWNHHDELSDVTVTTKASQVLKVRSVLFSRFFFRNNNAAEKVVGPTCSEGSSHASRFGDITIQSSESIHQF